MILGLPDIPVLTVGVAVFFSFVLLILWGLTFPKVAEDE